MYRWRIFLLSLAVKFEGRCELVFPVLEHEGTAGVFTINLSMRTSAMYAKELKKAYIVMSTNASLI